MQTSTRIIHEGEDRERYYGAVNPPVVNASLFTFPTMQAFLDRHTPASDRYTYTRDGNPTIRVLEDKIARLEQADGCIATASGMGAITAAIMTVLNAGDHALVVDSCYGPTRRFMDTLMARWGVSTTYYPPDADDLSPWLRLNTRLVYMESPGSHSFHLQDLAALATQARAQGAITIADNSWATPLYQQPHRLGVDIVVHSGTKYIAGHSDLVLGLITAGERLLSRIRPVAITLGATLGPNEAYLALRGLRTLPVRLAQHQANALRVAQWLEQHPKVRRVLYPGLPSFPRYELGRRQMSGYSSLFSIELLPPLTPKQRHRFVDSLRLFSIGVSWGGYESLIIPLLAQDDQTAALHRRLGLNDDCYRLSIGLEDPDDLIADLEQALGAYQPRPI
ncbi:MAG: cystathionine beta-lyase [Caldilineae bacterium]|nr:MAG: cystathionine beta-lyase [Caldilineae bacterium]